MKTGKDFIELTKYENLEPSDQAAGKEFPEPELRYQGEHVIELPEVAGGMYNKRTLFDAINKRRSIRKYTKTSLSLEELSFLLWTTQGVKEKLTGGMSLRTVPSAGARHAFETYLVINNVSGLEPGLYHFHAYEHNLLCLAGNDAIGQTAMRACFNQKMVRESAVTFIWAAVADRMTWKYSQRAYRYLHLDAGHVCQNLYLSAMELDCGVCAIAAFDDDKMNELIGIRDDNMFVIYVASVGKLY